MSLGIRSLGRPGLTVPALGLGCMGMSEGFGPAGEAEALSTIHRALDLGITLFDTADSFGCGANERLLGKALRKRRDGAVVATKFGIVREASGAFVGVNGRPDHVVAACDASLKRLDVDVIDLYIQHRRDTDVPIAETVGAMADLVSRGKVRYIGLAEVSAATVRAAHAVFPLSVVQSEYSLFTRDPEDGVLAACRELGIGFLAYGTLARGLLGGRIGSLAELAPDDWRRANPRFQPGSFEKNRELVKRLDRMAKDKECRVAQLALAWVLDRGKDVVALFGTKARRYLEENVDAVNLQLTDSDRERLDDTVPRDSVSGARYNEASRRWLDL